MAFGDFLQQAWNATAEASHAAMEKISDVAEAAAQKAEAVAKAAWKVTRTAAQSAAVLAQIPQHLITQALAAPGPTLLALRQAAAWGAQKAADAAGTVAPVSPEAQAAQAIFQAASKVFMPDDLRSTTEKCPKAIRQQLANTINKEKDLINQATAKGLGNSPIVRAAQAHVDAARKALMSDDVYNDVPTVDIPDAKRLTDDELRKLGISPDDLSTPSMHAALYKVAGNPNQYTLAYRGTASMGDALTDLGQGVGWETEAYNKTMVAAEKTKVALMLKDPLASFDLTGHSLGGGEVQAASAVTGARGVTFNPAGLSPYTVPNYDKEALDRNITNYSVDGEPLTTLNENVFGIPAAAGSMNSLPAPAGANVMDLHRIPSVEEGLTQTGNASINALNQLLK